MVFQISNRDWRERGRSANVDEHTLWGTPGGGEVLTPSIHTLKRVCDERASQSILTFYGKNNEIVRVKLLP